MYTSAQTAQLSSLSRFFFKSLLFSKKKKVHRKNSKSQSLQYNIMKLETHLITLLMNVIILTFYIWYAYILLCIVPILRLQPSYNERKCSSFEVIYKVIIYFGNMTRGSLFITEFLRNFPAIKWMSFLQIFQKLLIMLIIILLFLPIFFNFMSSAFETLFCRGFSHT